ncbi:glycoside hydrolase family 61 protein G [Favolaschia claudopus]|uniref:AA9 family lytic polysaccharide monooxygenase n=1 Tax=Favolaschia claudopus TaxID=2862362 RepID=A0AAW0D7F2_9AGAR
MAPLLSLLALVGLVSAGTIFQEVSVNGVDQGHGVGVRVPTSNAAITDLNSPNLICNTNFVQPVSQAVIKVPAGGQVTAQFHRTGAGYTGPDPADPIDPTNKGPVVAYLAAVPSATQTNVSGLKWFKIFESGLNEATHQWGSDLLFINKGNVTLTIPPCIASGDYLLRVEYIGLEYASSYPGAQFFMSCAQLSVTGTSAKVVAPSTVSIPGVYKSTDSGIVTSVFGISSYTVPGPAVFTC